MDFVTQVKKKVHCLFVLLSEEQKALVFAIVAATSPLIVFVSAIFLFVGWQLHIHALELVALVGFLYVIAVFSYTCDKLLHMWGVTNKETLKLLKEYSTLMEKDSELINAHRNLRREYVTLANRYHDLVELYEDTK